MIRCLIFIAVLAGIALGQIPGVRLIPIAEGWAKNQINAAIFRRNAVTSYKETQFVAFYDADSRVVVAKRRFGSDSWEIRNTGFKGEVKDAHNSISIAVDGRGLVHLTWDHHNSPLKYSRSTEPYGLEFEKPQPMAGTLENRVTYPEFHNLPDGRLLFLYRDGESGNGRLVMNSYSTKTGKWTRVQENLIDGEGKRSAYTQIAVGRNGWIHMSWVWRETPDVASNHDICYARSFDGGRTWTKSTGEPYRLPITSDNAEIAWKVPQNSELINQTSMAVDNSGRPSVATYWRDADSPVPQYRVVYLRDGRWRMSQVSDRKTPFSLSGGGTKRIPISRPQIAVDGRRVYVIFRDEERGNRPSVAVAEAIERGWRIVDLADNDLGMWEPSFDLNLWNRKKILDLFVQRVGQGDGERLEDLEPQMISILEWRPR